MKKPTVYKIEVYVVPSAQIYTKLKDVDAAQILSDVDEALSYIDTTVCITEPTLEQMEVVPKSTIPALPTTNQ
mgnify:CR=1 FL=1|tara:strand:+ start:94 stop:312 length:219 start_codon:yes stop_codon:yes gene_type:complete